jgi:hypothetical protein
MLVATWRNHVNVASCNANIKVFDQRICCNGDHRETSFIAGALVLYCNDEGLQLARLILSWTLWCLHDRQRPWPSCPLWQRTRRCLARRMQPYCPLWRGAHHCLARRMRPISLVARGSSLYPTQLPSLAVKGFVVTLFGKGLVVALLDEYGLLGDLAILNLGVFAPLVITWHDMVIVASCKQQHKYLIVAWELYLFFPCICCFIVVTPGNMTIKK